MKRELLLRQNLLLLFAILVGTLQSAVYAQTTYTQSSDSLGLVVMQAEDFTVNKDGTGIKAGDVWEFATDTAGFNGTGYMQSVMTAGDGDIGNAENFNAKLTFDVNFVYTGTHYLWAHVYFPDGSGDSFFYGLDSSVVNRVDGSPYVTWKWDEGNASFNVDTLGLHTVDIMQREPTAIIDMIIVTRDGDFDPTTDSSWYTPPISYQQSSDSLGLVVIPAEGYSLNKAGHGIKAGDSWISGTDTTGFLGDGYMQSVMSAGDGDITNAETVNAKLTYNVDFVHTGTHYLWAHVYFPDGSGDSFFYGLNGSVVNRVDGSPYGAYKWDEGNSSFNVDTIGMHTVDIMQREPNAIVDMIIVTRDGDFDPTVDSSWYIPPPPPLTYYQNSDSLGLVVISAEDFTENNAGTGIKDGDSWEFGTDTTGFLGDGYMQSVMAAGDGDITNAETVNAKLTYNVEFVHTGTHYLWALVYFPDGSGDSFFYGLNGSVINRVDGDPYGAYKWDQGNSSFNVDTMGLHTIDIMQREPTAIVDMIIVTRDPNFDPVADSSWINPPPPVEAQYEVVFVTPSMTSHDTTTIQAIEAYEGGTVFSVTVLEKSIIDSTDLAQLDTADVVVMGRNIGSADVGAAAAIWDSISRPVMAMGLWGLRESRANWVPAGIECENLNGDTLVVNGIIQNNDTVFGGLIDTIVWWNGSYSAFVPDSAHIAAGNGRLMVESEDLRPLFIRWDAFEEYYPGAGHEPNHIRSYMGLGNDNASPANYFGFSEDGAMIFFNELMILAGLGEAVDTSSTDAIGPILEDANIKMYPNPTRDLVNIESDFNIQSIRIVNMMGAGIMAKKVNATETVIDMSGFSSGVYFVIIEGRKGIRTFRLKKQ